MSRPLTVRNLTAQPLTIRLVERYEAADINDVPAGEKRSSPSSSSRRTKWIRNGTYPTPDELGGKAKQYRRHEVEIRLMPFGTHIFDSDTTQRDPGQLLRVTLHGDDSGKWRIDVPLPSTTSQKLTPLVMEPPHDYFAVYLPSSTLVILESFQGQSWMEKYRDGTSLTALSIPGTHNSHTCYTALPSVRCQAVSVIEQLENGIRFLDIRVQPTSSTDTTKETLNLVHGAFAISLTSVKRFRAVLDEMQDFLGRNPSETIILSLKREGTGSATDEHLSLILRDHYTADSSKWYTEPRIPSLGEVRGKIVLLRRFALAGPLQREWQGRGWGLNAEDWASNATDCKHGHVRVQDYYEVLTTGDIQKKIGFCCDHLERAGQAICAVPDMVVKSSSKGNMPADPLFLNFMTGSNFWSAGCWPHKIAAKINPEICSFLCERYRVADVSLGNGSEKRLEGDGGLGIVICDWVGKDGNWDIVKIILAMNGRLLLRQKEHR